LKVEDVRRITVVGVGLMGHGIALEYAAAGYDVRVNDASQEELAAAMKRIRGSLRMLADLGIVASADADVAFSRVTPEVSLERAAEDSDIVVEAIFEELDLKRRIFAALDATCRQDTILLSNTSTYVPSALASATRRPDRVAVSHYFNPPFLIPVVEVVRGPETSPDTIELVTSVLQSMGKRPALIQKETLGFIGNRVQFALYREALALVDSGVASVEDVDTVIKYGFGRRLSVAGPFEVGDLAGWDVLAAIAGMLFPDIDASREVPPILQERIDRGDFGVKSGKGFHQWTPESAEVLRRRIGEALADLARRDRSEGA